LYAWCGNNPISKVDPSGMWSFAEAGAKFGGFLFGDAGASIGAQMGAMIDYGIGFVSGFTGYAGSYGYGYSGGVANFNGRVAGGKAQEIKTVSFNPRALKVSSWPPTSVASYCEISGNCVPSRYSTMLTEEDMWSGGAMGNVFRNCEYYTNLGDEDHNYLVKDALEEEDWDEVWQKEQDWVGGQATITSVSGGISMLTGKATGPWGMGVSAVGHFGWFYFSSKKYQSQDVRDYCEPYLPIRPGTWPDTN
jgi:hypothetical protein